MSQHAHTSGELRLRMPSDALPRRWSQSIVLAFAVAFGAAVVIGMLQGEKPFLTDSGSYWTMGSLFTVNGHFSLLNFSHRAKGYGWALVLYGLQTLQHEFGWTPSSLVKLVNAFIFASIGAVLGPALIRAVWPTRPSWGIVRRLALVALLLAFWSGYLNTPTSDFPALAAALLALVAVVRIDSPGWMLVAGAALSLAFNIRAAFILLVPFVVASIPWAWFNQRGTLHASSARRALCAALFVVGFAVVALPQSLSAHRQFGTWSFVPGVTESESVGAFYSSGIEAQAYDTYVLNGEARVEMKYIFPPGKRLLEQLPGGKVTSTSQYVDLLWSHPLLMADVFARHIINHLDPLYSTAYVEHLHNAGRTLGRIAGFLLMFVALLRLLWPSARRLLGPGRLRYLAALPLCVVTAVPMMGERRYMLPVYMLIYILALTPSWPNPIDGSGVGLRRFRVPMVIATAFVLYSALVWYVTSDAISNLTIIDGVTRTRLNIR